tara:strand:- start:58343 stop:58540 length:198 start_codon:yes stop_codon:yes gene_type:complete
MPNNVYNGQKPTIAVSKNTMPSTSNTIPNVPVTTFPKYNPANTMAKIILTILSAVPTLCFIALKF